MALQQMRVVHLLMLVLVGGFVYFSYSLMSVSTPNDVNTHSILRNTASFKDIKHNYDDGNSSAAAYSDILPVSKVSGVALSVIDTDQSQYVSDKQNNTNAISKAVVPSISKGNATTNNTAAVDQNTKGILAGILYESGHAEANSELCPEMGGPVKLLILIMSAPSNKEARISIRQTWGHYGTRRDVSLGFLLGSTSNPTLEETLIGESYMYGDIIRGHFLDSYNNLTLKTISMLEWTDRYCPRVKFVLKTDDDMFINVPKLLSFIDKHQKFPRVIFGRLAKKWKPIRNKKSKYYVAPQQYLPAVFPDFTTGPAYLISSDVIHDMYITALNHTYLKLEDVFTTGIVARAVGVRLIHIREFLNKRISFNPCNIQKAISIHMIKTSEQFDLWKKLLDGRSKCK